MVQVKLTQMAIDYVAVETGITQDAAKELLQSAISMCEFEGSPTRRAADRASSQAQESISDQPKI